MRVDEQGKIVGPVAKKGEPLRMAYDDVEFVAMNDKITLAVGSGMDRLPPDLDPAEGQAEELTSEFVVGARDEHHPRAPPHLSEQFLDDIVMRLGPVPAGAEPPAVDDVADQVDRVRLDMAQHVQDEMGLAPARAQVQIRQEQGPVAMGVLGLGHQWPPREGANNEK